MKEVNKLFSDNLKMFMKYYGYTQEKLADALEYKHSAVSTWVKGQKFPRLETIDKMCRLFHCSRSDLLERSSTKETIEKTVTHNRILEYLEILTPAGMDKVLTFLEDLNPKYYRESHG